MATPALLSEALREADDNLTLRLSQWFTQVHSEKLFVNVRFSPHGQGPQRLNGEPLEVNRQLEGINNFVDRIEDLIREKLGPAPFGVLRIQGYEPRKSASPSLDFTRTLIPEEAAGLNDANSAVYRAINADLLRRNAQLETHLVSMSSQLAIALGSTSQALQGAATIRTASSASNELSGLGPLVSLIAIIVLYPQLKEILGLPPDAPMTDVIKAARTALFTGLPPGGPSSAPGAPSSAPSAHKWTHPVPEERAAPVGPGAAFAGYLLGASTPEAAPFFVTPAPGPQAVMPSPANGNGAPHGSDLLAHLRAELDRDPSLGVLLASEVKADPELAGKLEMLLKAAK